MQRISIVNVFGIFKTNFRLVMRNNIVLAIIYLSIIPFVRGIANLDVVHSAECLEQSVILIGMIILVPLNAAEQSKSLQEVIYTKKVQQWIVMLIRFVMAIISLFVLTGIFAEFMVWNNCKFPYMQYVTGTIISEIALGSVGLFAATVSNSVIIGYLASMGYFLFNMLGNITSENIVCLFSMATEKYATKVWLLGISALLITISVIYTKRKKCY